MLPILLILIFIRPFISSLAFPHLNYVYSSILLGFLIIWLFQKGLPLNKIKTLKFPLVLLLLALLISTIFSADKISGLKQLYKYISGILIFLVALCLNHKDRVRVIKTIILAGFIISLMAIYQYFFGFRHISDYLAGNNTVSAFTLDYIQCQRVYFPFITPNTLGIYLAMIILLILAIRDRKKKLFANPFFFIIIPVSFALLLTKSLGAFLSLFFSLVIYFYLLTLLNKSPAFTKTQDKGYILKQRMLSKKGLLLITASLIIIGLIFLSRQAAIKEHLRPAFSLAQRMGYWKDTLTIIKSAPLTGIGLGNFNLTQSRFAHNSYLQIWAETGILGIISFLWLIIAVFKSAVKNIKVSENKKLITGLITANAVFLIHNLVDFSFFLPEVALIWWVILGLGVEQQTNQKSSILPK